MTPLLAWTLKAASAILLAVVTAATARAFAGRTQAAAFAGAAGGVLAGLIVLALEPRHAGAVACAGVAVFVHTARWREWLLWPPIGGAVALEPALGLPLITLPLLRGATPARVGPIVLAAGVVWSLRQPLGLTSPALALAAILLMAGLSLGIGRAEVEWRPGRGFVTSLKVLGALMPALAVLALLLGARGILDHEPLAVGGAILAAVALGGLLFAAILGGILLLATRHDGRPVALGLGAAALVGVILLGLPAALALLIPFVWSVGLGAHALRSEERGVSQGASVART